MDGTESSTPDVDVVVVGAGMAGLYLLWKLRELGFTARAFETGDDVGGTWYWNRYPGARCDIRSIDYSYSFDAELDETWEWSEKYATQPEILRYLQHVADRHDLRRDITFSTKIDAARWHDESNQWRLQTSAGDEVRCRHYVMATGCLSVPKDVDIEGLSQFAGPTYSTGRWPHEGVDFTGRKVAVIGTGSSGIQSIPIIAGQAAELTVYQRTPNFSVPAGNGPVAPELLAEVRSDRAAYRESARWSRGGVPFDQPMDMALMATPEEREERFEAGWQEGTIFGIMNAFADLLVNEESNEFVSEFVRSKIRDAVDDPATAEKLCPKDYPLGTKRLCLDSNYYSTFNLPHVDLIDLRDDPIESITASGIESSSGERHFDDIVLATGFDAMTGAIVAVDIEGRDGVSLRDEWADGPVNYLGVMVENFPNFYMVTGPGSPSVLSNMSVSIEQHVEWITQCINDLREDGYDAIEPTAVAQSGWQQHMNDCGDITLFPQANSWYMGANVPGKPRVLLPYLGGVDVYRETTNQVIEQGYLGFKRSGAAGEVCNDGVINRLQPDISMMLAMMAEMGMPPIESLPHEDARAMMTAGQEMRMPGPDVGEIVDGTFPGGDGTDLNYRLFRPDTPGPHPVVAYFHGGGWVLGDQVSDEPFCRDLCVRLNSIVVSCDYRHAPEAVFPAAADDALAAVEWAAANATSLGGDGTLLVAGWSAGANIAAVACQTARDNGGPELAGQLLVTPVTDCDMSRPSYAEVGEGHVLTTGLMKWFWDYYLTAEDRSDPKASPLHGELAGLPPAVIVTCEFDPLRDEGNAYAAALQEAGVATELIEARGHIHTSLPAVDMILSGAPVRTEIAAATRQLLGP